MGKPGFLHRARQGPGTARNLLVLSAIIPAMETGEWVWMSFMPLYLKSLGATALGISLYGVLKAVLPVVYPYPGGWLSDRLGSRRALLLFTLTSGAGYAVLIVSGRCELILGGMFLVMAWGGLALPTLFAVVADSMPRARRGLGFSIQSVLQRCPILWGPALGAALMAAWSNQGLQMGMAMNLLFALGAFVAVAVGFREGRPPEQDRASAWRIWQGMDGGLKRLLVAESLARGAEELGRVFVVLYVCDVLRHSREAYGGLMAVRGATELLVYLALARVADGLNRKPLVALAFAFFGLFPVLLVAARDGWLLPLAFVANGLSRIGEPARKALIVDLAPATTRGRVVGLYYLVRGLAVATAPLVGGLLWRIRPELPFQVGGGLGAASVLFYLLWGRSVCVPAHQHLQENAPVATSPFGRNYPPGRNRVVVNLIGDGKRLTFPMRLLR